MLRLRSFGNPLVESDGGPVGEAAAQRKSLALLALVAAAGDRGISRDKLLAYLWPEAAPERAAHRLSQLVYSLRRAAGTDALFLGTGDLRLNPDIIRTDLADFNEAFARGEPERAAAVYAGPFLDGFHLTGAAEFDRWMEGERAIYAGKYATALGSLITAASARGDLAAAAEWSRRLTVADPLDSRFAVRYMDALSAAGDRAGALRFARVHEALVREQLDGAPDPAVAALAERIREQASVGSEASVAGTPPGNAQQPSRGTSFSKPSRATGRIEDALAERYRLEREIGRGRTATVYLAHDLKLERRVAVKILRPEIAVALSTQRFLREIRLLAQLQHPHILPLFDSGEAKGSPYYVMPFIEGASLRARLDRENQLTVSEGVRIAREVAEALDHAHRQGVIHRDIRPGNILLEDGHAVVANFGLARAFSVAGDDQITLTREVLGELRYISPEQAAGAEDLDGRSDIYSLGCVLWEMLVGEAPSRPAANLGSGTPTGARPKLRDRRRDASAAAEAVIDRALATLPDNRFPTAAQLAMALKALGGGAESAGSAQATGGTADASVAILPFLNLSPDAESEYFSDGITEELTSALAGLPNLRVAARTSAFAFKGKLADVREIGQRLNVHHLVEGSVRRAGDRMRIIAQLVSASDGYQVWTSTYDRTVADVFAVQNELARAIAGALTSKVVSPADALVEPPTSSIEAYALYLNGRYCWNKRTAAGFRAAAEYFERAIALDPRYARAYSGLSYCHAMLSFDEFGETPPREGMPRAKAAALKAHKLAPELRDAHSCFAVIALLYDWDWATAEAEFALARSLEHDGLPLSEVWYVLYLAVMGRTEESIAAATSALVQDPLSLGMRTCLGRAYHLARLYDQAIAQFRSVLELEPSYAPGHVALARAYQAQGSFEDALGDLERAISIAGRRPLLLAYLGATYGKMNRYAAAETILQELRAAAEISYVPTIYQANVLAGIGRLDEAFRLYDVACEERSGWLVFLRDPTWDPLRSDPRFARLARKVGLDAATPAPSVSPAADATADIPVR